MPSTSIVSVASITSSRGALDNVTCPSSAMTGVCVRVAPTPVANVLPDFSFIMPVVNVKSSLPVLVEETAVSV